jgi:hypothetical protein
VAAVVEEGGEVYVVELEEAGTCRVLVQAVSPFAFPAVRSCVVVEGESQWGNCLIAEEGPADMPVVVLGLLLEPRLRLRRRRTALRLKRDP